MKKQKIIVATHSKNKLREIQSFFANHSTISEHFQFNALAELSDEQAIEDGLSFVENALIKARYASKIANLPALADDSGLCVDAIGGQPGIYSSRFAKLDGIECPNDQQNNHCLLEKLKNFPNASERKAHFVTVLVYLRFTNDPDPIIVQSYLDGRILQSPRGEFGFGYDPLFYLPEMQKTLAEIPLNEKNQISHRAKALVKLKEKLDWLKS